MLGLVCGRLLVTFNSLSCLAVSRARAPPKVLYCGYLEYCADGEHQGRVRDVAGVAVSVWSATSGENDTSLCACAAVSEKKEKTHEHTHTPSLALT